MDFFWNALTYPRSIFGWLWGVIVPERLRIATRSAFYRGPKSNKTRPISNNYVPLEAEEKVYSALEKPGPRSPTVVLLHGGPGRGKSAVARQIRRAYGEYKNVFSAVVKLECGPDVDKQAKLIELANRLRGKDSEIGTRAGSAHLLEATLQSLLQNQMLLIILDDLEDADIVRSLLRLSGPKVKFLITSQMKYLCRHLNCKLEGVAIDELEKHGSICSKILAVNVGFPHGNIPDHLKSVAYEVLDVAQGIPLVIATLGAQIELALREEIGQGGEYELEVWSSVLDKFRASLDEYKPLMDIHGEAAYSVSYWSALKLSIDKLGPEEKNLFVLFGMCKGPSISPNILQYLYSYVMSKEICNTLAFLQWKKRLEDRHLLVADESLLSMHSLTRIFILEQMELKVESIARILHELSSEMDLGAHCSAVIEVFGVIACLCLDTQFSEPIASLMHRSLDVFSETKRNIIEPIMRQIVREENSRKETGELLMSARQVFLKFICDDALLQNEMLQLLKCPRWVQTTLGFLQVASFLDEPFWLKNPIQNFLGALLRIFKDRSHPDHQTLAAETLTWLFARDFHRQHVGDMISTPGVLHQVLLSLSEVENPHLRSSTVDLLSYVSTTTRREIKLSILGYPGMLSSLVKSLANDETASLPVAQFFLDMATSKDSAIQQILVNSSQLLDTLAAALSKCGFPELQTTAASTLASLGSMDDATRHKIVSIPGLLHNLVTALKDAQNLELQEEAARVISILAAHEDTRVQHKIAITPHLRESLVALLSEDSLVTHYAVSALKVILGCVNDSTKRKIGRRMSGLLDRSVMALRDSQSIDHQRKAAGTIAFLLEQGVKINPKLTDYHELLDSFAALLLKEDDSPLQTSAMLAICSLGRRDDSIKHKIMDMPRLLSKLVTVLRDDQNSSLKWPAAETVAMLAVDGDIAIKRTLADWQEALEGLAALVFEKEDLSIQRCATTALNSLGYADDSIKIKIVNIPGLLDKLVTALRDDSNSKLPQLAATIILMLATHESTAVRRRITDSPQLLESLAAVLCEAQNPLLQQCAMSALGIFGSLDDSFKGATVNISGLLDSLVTTLKDNQNPSLQGTATRVIHILATHKDNAITRKIAAFPQLLESLAGLLFKQEDPSLQEHAGVVIDALGLLASADDSIKGEVVNIRGLLDNMVMALIDDQNPGLQRAAVVTILILATHKSTTIKRKIAACEQLLEGLAALLFEGKDPLTQQRIIDALGLLGSADHSIKGRIVNILGLLDSLVIALRDDENPGLQKTAATTIMILGSHRDIAINGKIGKQLLESLVALLAKGQNDPLQNSAAGALLVLEHTDDLTKHSLLDIPETLQNLVKALEVDWNSDLQKTAAGIIYDLASHEDAVTRRKIASSPELLESLATSLGKHQNLPLQEQATRALMHLAQPDSAIKQRLQRFPGLLDNLSKALHDDHNDVLRQSTKSLIKVLASREDSVIKHCECLRVAR